MLGLYLAFTAFVACHFEHRLDPAGSPLGHDFSVFYEAARFAASGHAAEAYDDPAMQAALRDTIPGAVAQLPFRYSPLFQLMLLPLGWPMCRPGSSGWRTSAPPIPSLSGRSRPLAAASRCCSFPDTLLVPAPPA